MPDLVWQIWGLADLDGDGKADILRRNATMGETYAWLMNGKDPVVFGSVGTVSDLDWQIQATADLDGGGEVDLLGA